MIAKFIFLLFIFPVFSYSFVKVAFFETFYQGKRVSLEEGGRFSHLALRVDEGWLHSHYQRGVEVITDFKDLGFDDYNVVFMTSLKYYFKPSDYKAYLGINYDRSYGWGNDSLYCSELIAKVLGINPFKMQFNSSIWGNEHSSRGELGISPDEIYEIMK